MARPHFPHISTLSLPSRIDPVEAAGIVRDTRTLIGALSFYIGAQQVLEIDAQNKLHGTKPSFVSEPLRISAIGSEAIREVLAERYLHEAITRGAATLGTEEADDWLSAVGFA